MNTSWKILSNGLTTFDGIVIVLMLIHTREHIICLRAREDSHSASWPSCDMTFCE